MQRGSSEMCCPVYFYHDLYRLWHHGQKDVPSLWHCSVNGPISNGPACSSPPHLFPSPKSRTKAAFPMESHELQEQAPALWGTPWLPNQSKCFCLGNKGFKQDCLLQPRSTNWAVSMQTRKSFWNFFSNNTEETSTLKSQNSQFACQSQDI